MKCKDTSADPIANAGKPLRIGRGFGIHEKAGLLATVAKGSEGVVPVAASAALPVTFFPSACHFFFPYLLFPLPNLRRRTMEVAATEYCLVLGKAHFQRIAILLDSSGFIIFPTFCSLLPSIINFINWTTKVFPPSQIGPFYLGWLGPISLLVRPIRCLLIVEPAWALCLQPRLGPDNGPIIIRIGD